MAGIKSRVKGMAKVIVGGISAAAAAVRASRERNKAAVWLPADRVRG